MPELTRASLADPYAKPKKKGRAKKSTCPKKAKWDDNEPIGNLVRRARNAKGQFTKGKKTKKSRGVVAGSLTGCPKSKPVRVKSHCKGRPKKK